MITSVKGAEVIITAEVTVMQNRMKNSISGQLKKPKTEARAVIEEPRIAKSRGDKAEIKTKSVVVKGLKIEDELETAYLDERKIESKEFDSIKMFDSDMTNQLKAMRKKG